MTSYIWPFQSQREFFLQPLFPTILGGIALHVIFLFIFCLLIVKQQPDGMG